MSISNLYDLFLKQSDQKDHFSLRKEMIVKIFLYIAAFILTLFSLVNLFIYHQYTVGYIDATSALIAIYALLKLRDKKTLSLAIRISSLNLFVFFLLFLYFNQNEDNGLVWLIFLPIFIIPLNGHKKGLIISLIFYAIAFYIAYNGIGVWQEGLWNTHSFIRFVASSLLLVYITYITELAIYRNNIQLQEKEEQNKRYLEKLEDLAQKDYLTKIYNRRHIHELLEKELHKSRRYNTTVSVAILDIDYFKRINDTYGHQCGDDVLIEFTSIIQKELRKSDIFGRWGGEEFVIIFPHTFIEDAKEKCEQLRLKITQTNFFNVGVITCSIGVAEYDKNSTLDHFISQADEALYKAKEAGRNQVRIF